MKKAARIIMVRHGQSQANANPHLHSNDSDLTEEGISQIKKVADLLKHEKIAHVYSSHLVRAVHTGKILNAHHNVAHTVIEALQERKYGSLFDRKDPKEALTAYFDAQSQLADSQKWHFKHVPDMESEYEGVMRLLSQLNSLATKHTHETIMVVGHGNLMRMFLVHHGFVNFDEAPPNSMQNGGSIEFEIDGKEIKILSVSGLIGPER